MAKSITIHVRLSPTLSQHLDKMIELINQQADEDEQCDRSKYIRYLLRRDLKQMRNKTTQQRQGQDNYEDLLNMVR